MAQSYNINQTLCLTILLTWICLGSALYFPNTYPRLNYEPKSIKGFDNPLIITPYLKSGLISLAQNLSRVPFTEKLGFKSYAGFFNICEKYKSYLYFWYFPPFSLECKSPVILWLQGGPGGSSLYGLFEEIGPLIPSKTSITTRKYHWALKYHLIFIDNPVGAGFSFTKDKAGYCHNQECIAQGLYTSLIQFFQLFPELKRNGFYICGESYAGKYIPSLAMKIHQENAAAFVTKSYINLKGLAMGNAYCDPINQLDYGHYLYEHGLIDKSQLKVFLSLQSEIAKQIRTGHPEVADVLLARLLCESDQCHSYFKQFTGYDYCYNILRSKAFDETSAFTFILRSKHLRNEMHVGALPFNDGSVVQMHLILDLMESVAPVISELLSHYRIMFYNGQLDIIVAYPLIENVLENLRFSGEEEYRTATRHIWKVNGTIAGYVKVGANLTNVLVRNAGHMVPRDQPVWALDMITRFINNYRYKSNPNWAYGEDVPSCMSPM